MNMEVLIPPGRSHRSAPYKLSVVTAPAPVQPSTTKQSRPWTERK